jgi:hypothetical protein
MPSRRPKYSLIDAVAQHEKTPKTFQIPDPFVSANLFPGMGVKLIFVAPKGSPAHSERMWVNIVSNDNGQYTGTLDNDPILFPKNRLRAKDTIVFSAKHIIDMLIPDDFWEKVKDNPALIAHATAVAAKSARKFEKGPSRN